MEESMPTERPRQRYPFSLLPASSHGGLPSKKFNLTPQIKKIQVDPSH